MDARSHRPHSKYKAKLLTQHSASDVNFTLNGRFATKTEATEAGIGLAYTGRGGHKNHKLQAVLILREDPVILGLPGIVQPGEDVILNCTTGLAMPPANIIWYIDGKPERMEPWMVNNTSVSLPNEFDLRSSWRSLHLRVNPHTPAISVRCEATQPTWPAYIRSTNASLIVARTPHLSMFTASGSISTAVEVSVAVLASCLSSVHIFSKYSALSEV
ncbi:hypothetical protein evm_015185 [Chilo suppressalis]|nr:hypothetical protein evm_015185 [Chilo suppressalis]